LGVIAQELGPRKVADIINSMEGSIEGTAVCSDCSARTDIRSSVSGHVIGVRHDVWIVSSYFAISRAYVIKYCSNSDQKAIVKLIAVGCGFLPLME
jgi:hypothetical protein